MAEALHPNYDPDWESRFDEAEERFNHALKMRDPAAIAEAAQAQRMAYWAQFRTMAEIRDFHFDALRRHAEAEKLILVLPDLRDDCTWEEINTAYRVAWDALDDQLAERMRPPYRHPEYLDAFYDEPGGHRFSTRYEYVGNWGAPGVCNLTIEYQEEHAHVCFTLLPNGGPSAINLMESLATRIYHEAFKERYEPTAIRWYAYFRRPGIGGREGFMQAHLIWHRDRYTTVESWHHYATVPRVIGETVYLAER